MIGPEADPRPRMNQSIAWTESRRLSLSYGHCRDPIVNNGVQSNGQIRQIDAGGHGARVQAEEAAYKKEEAERSSNE